MNTHTYQIPASWINTRISIKVIGVGGTGSVVLSLLAQMNYLLRALSNDSTCLDVTAIDSDHVSQFNLGRQNFFPFDLHKNKAKVMIERLNQSYGTDWQYSERHYKATEYESAKIVLTCVDNIATRVEIGKALANKIKESLWGDCGNDSHSGQVIFGHLGQPKTGIKLPNWYDLYGQHMAEVKEDVTESCSTEMAITKQDFGVNHQSALLLVQPIWQLLRHGKLNYSGTYFDVKEPMISSLAMHPTMWQSFGYEQGEKWLQNL